MDAGVIGALVNLAILALLVPIEHYELKRIIKPKGKFYRMKDYSRMVIGDTVGISIMNYVAFSVIAIDYNMLLVSILTGVAFAVVFYFFATRSSLTVDDSGFVSMNGKRRITLFGRIHMMYFVYQVSLLVMLVWNVSSLSALHWSLLGIGSVVYLISVFLDVKKGNF